MWIPKPKKMAVPERKSKNLRNQTKPDKIEILANLPARRIIPIPWPISFFES